jgi:hypothetical protein
MTDTKNNDAMRELVWKTEERLLQNLNDLPPKVDPDAPADAPPTEPVPEDSEAERAAFADFLKSLEEHAEDDGTEIEVLSLDEFMAETFTPPRRGNDADNGD